MIALITGIGSINRIFALLVKRLTRIPHFFTILLAAFGRCDVNVVFTVRCKDPRVRAVNGIDESFVDPGLLANPEVISEAEQGKYKVPTLRNIAVTEPYMHNGVFRDLATVIKFYDHFLTNSDFPDNPETGAPWRESQIPDTISLMELRDGRKMDEADVEAVVCFLRTLTDARCEHLIQDKGIDCGD